MAQAQGILGHGLIEFVPGRAALFREQHFVASESSKPVAGRSLAGGNPQIGEKIADGAASPYGQSGSDGGSFEEMKVGIDEAGGDRTPRQFHQMGSRADECLEQREGSMGDDASGGYRDRVAAGVAHDLPFMQNQIGLDGWIGHNWKSIRAGQWWAPGAARNLIGRRKRLRLLDLHFAFATLERPLTGFVAKHLGAAFLAQVALAKHVCHFSFLLY